MKNPRRFAFIMKIDGEQVGDTGVIEIDQSVIDSVDDEWRSVFYPSIVEPEHIAAMIAYNMVEYSLSLSEIEGFMMDDDLARIVQYPSGYNDYECEASAIIE